MVVNLDLPPLERVQDYITNTLANTDYLGHDKDIFRKHATLKSCSLPPNSPFPTVVTRFRVTEVMENGAGNLHGGMTATLFDNITTLPLAMVAKAGFWQYLGVSRTLSVTYLRAAPIGEEVELEAELLSVGARLACIRGTMRRVRDGAIVASAIHDKANTDPPTSTKL